MTASIRHPEVPTMATHGAGRRRPGRESGQIIVIAALAMIAIIGGVALVLEGGNAYANQRVAQNAADAVAHAGATVLAQRLGGTAKDDEDVADWMKTIADANGLASFTGYYVNVLGLRSRPPGSRPRHPANGSRWAAWARISRRRPRPRACG